MVTVSVIFSQISNKDPSNTLAAENILMPIQLLPLQLANQIAAGEVVERPAAVVKELVENSLDAGASQIDIEIEGGGSQLIRIRDNGTGIAKEELTLALARHATSKISSLTDLQAVTSLGFRGEALASINAVSRLSITSRTAQQAQAWQIYAEGREAAASFKPLAHPVGTTVEVLELFYNTPARRKFLRSAKTEFSHIDEVVRRIALGCFRLGVTLTHNGKRIRCYRPAGEQATREQRLAAVCGQPFAQQALAVSGQQQQLGLQGWVSTPLGARAHSDLQYCYVNGRMIRDKLITHAIRQAYHYQLAAQQYPAFVLFLTIDPQQVDVNVHPAKQEVRFYQARMVHDFIYQAVLAAVAEQTQNNHAADRPVVPLPSGVDPSAADPWSASAAAPSTLAALASAPAPPAQQQQRCLSLPTAGPLDPPSPGWSAAKLAPYRALLQLESTHDAQMGRLPTIMHQGDNSDTVDNNSEVLALCGRVVAARSLGRALAVWQQHYVVLERSSGLALLSLPLAKRHWQRAQLLPASQQLPRQPLLFPLALALSASQAAAAERYQAVLAQLALAFTLDQQQLTLQTVPALLGQQDLPSLLLALLDYLHLHLHPLVQADAAGVTEWLLQRLTPAQQSWQLSQAIQLLTELERCCPQLVDAPPAGLLQPIDLTVVAAQLKTE